MKVEAAVVPFRIGPSDAAHHESGSSQTPGMFTSGLPSVPVIPKIPSSLVIRWTNFVSTSHSATCRGLQWLMLIESPIFFPLTSSSKLDKSYKFFVESYLFDYQGKLPMLG